MRRFEVKGILCPWEDLCQPKGEGCTQDPPLEGMRAPSEAGAAFTDVENEALGQESQPERQCVMRTPTSLRIFFSTMFSGTVHKQGQGAHGEVKGNSPAELKTERILEGFQSWGGWQGKDDVHQGRKASASRSQQVGSRGRTDFWPPCEFPHPLQSPFLPTMAFHFRGRLTSLLPLVISVIY